MSGQKSSREGFMPGKGFSMERMAGSKRSPATIDARQDKSQPQQFADWQREIDPRRFLASE
jgi:hypothetical protein